MVGAKPEGTGQKPRGSERRLSRWSTDRIIIHARRFKTLFMELLTVEEVLGKIRVRRDQLLGRSESGLGRGELVARDPVVTVV